MGELTKDQFADALQNRELQLCVAQARPKDVREALASALEMEAFLCTSVGAPASWAPQKAFPTRELRTRRARAATGAEEKASTSSGRSSPVEFKGACWACGEEGHMRRQCKGERRTRSLERPAALPFQSCCWSCGKFGHFPVACPTPKEVREAGGKRSLAGGRGRRKPPRDPFAI